MYKKPHLSNDWKPKRTNKWTHIKWTSETIRIDNQTGEILTQHQIKQDGYYKVHTDKIHRVSDTEPRGHTIYIQKYERTKQARLW